MKYLAGCAAALALTACVNSAAVEKLNRLNQEAAACDAIFG